MILFGQVTINKSKFNDQLKIYVKTSEFRLKSTRRSGISILCRSDSICYSGILVLTHITNM